MVILTQYHTEIQNRGISTIGRQKLSKYPACPDSRGFTVPGIEDLFESLDELLKKIDDWDRTNDDLPISSGSLDTLLLSNENLLMKLAPGEGRKTLYFS